MPWWSVFVHNVIFVIPTRLRRLLRFRASHLFPGGPFKRPCLAPSGGSSAMLSALAQQVQASASPSNQGTLPSPTPSHMRSIEILSKNPQLRSMMENGDSSTTAALLTALARIQQQQNSLPGQQQPPPMPTAPQNGSFPANPSPLPHRSNDGELTRQQLLQHLQQGLPGVLGTRPPPHPAQQPQQPQQQQRAPFVALRDAIAVSEAAQRHVASTAVAAAHSTSNGPGPGDVGGVGAHAPVAAITGPFSPHELNGSPLPEHLRRSQRK